MPGNEVGANFWMQEYITPWDLYGHGITSVLAHRCTAYQEMYIVETGAYGKALVLDGKWQSCTGDGVRDRRAMPEYQRGRVEAVRHRAPLVVGKAREHPLGVVRGRRDRRGMHARVLA